MEQLNGYRRNNKNKKDTIEQHTGPLASAAWVERADILQRLSSPDVSGLWLSAPTGCGKSILLNQISNQAAVRKNGLPPVLIDMSAFGSEDDMLDDLHVQFREILSSLSRNSADKLKRFEQSVKLLQEHLLDRDQFLPVFIDGLHQWQVALLGALSDAIDSKDRLFFVVAITEVVPISEAPLAIPRSALVMRLPDLCFSLKEIQAHFERCGYNIGMPEAAKYFDKTGGIPVAVDMMLETYDQSPAHQCWFLTHWISNHLAQNIDFIDLVGLSSLSLMAEMDYRQASQLLGVDEAKAIEFIEKYSPAFLHFDEQSNKVRWSNLLQHYFYQMLLREHNALVPELFDRAALWLLNQECSSPCLKFLISSYHRPWGQRVLGGLCRLWMDQYNSTAIVQLVEQIPLIISKASPNLSLTYIWALIELRQFNKAADFIKGVDEWVLDSHFDPQRPFVHIENSLNSLHCLINHFMDSTQSMSDRIQRLECVVELESEFQGYLLSLYAKTLHSAGGVGMSRQALNRAIGFHRKHDKLVSLSMMESIRWMSEFSQGRVAMCIAEAQQFIDDLQARPNAHFCRANARAQAIVEVCLAHLFYESNDLPKAKALLLSAHRVLMSSDLRLISLTAEISFIRVQISEGHYIEAQAHVEQTQCLAEAFGCQRLLAMLCFEKIRLNCRLNLPIQSIVEEFDLESKCVSIETLFLDRYENQYMHWLKCQLLQLVLEKNYTAANVLAIKGLIKGLSLGNPHYQTVFANVKALCEYRNGDVSEAKATLSRAIESSKDHGFIRSFIDDDFGWAEVWDVMFEAHDFSSESDQDYFQVVDQQMYRPEVLLQSEEERLELERQQRLELCKRVGLTEKEYEILKLLSEGLCNKSIARRADIALTTVKWHLQNIFGKLEAKNRTEAVVKAQEYSILF